MRLIYAFDASAAAATAATVTSFISIPLSLYPATLYCSTAMLRRTPSQITQQRQTIAGVTYQRVV
jgi:hypothetical protein